jgi:hypothetical protein
MLSSRLGVDLLLTMRSDRQWLAVGAGELEHGGEGTFPAADRARGARVGAVLVERAVAVSDDRVCDRHDPAEVAVRFGLPSDYFPEVGEAAVIEKIPAEAAAPRHDLFQPGQEAR